MSKEPRYLSPSKIPGETQQQADDDFSLPAAKRPKLVENPEDDSEALFTQNTPLPADESEASDEEPSLEENSAAYKEVFTLLDDYLSHNRTDINNLIQAIKDVPGTAEEFKQHDITESILRLAVYIDSPELVAGLVTWLGIEPYETYPDPITDAPIYAFQAIPPAPQHYKAILDSLTRQDNAIHINASLHNNHYTTLHHVAENGSVDAWKYLLKKFKNLDFRDAYGADVILNAITHEDGKGGERLAALLQSRYAGAVSSAYYYEGAPLLHAIAGKINDFPTVASFLDVMNVLLMHQFPFSNVDQYGRLPSYYCANPHYRGYLDAIAYGCPPHIAAHALETQIRMQTDIDILGANNADLHSALDTMQVQITGIRQNIFDTSEIMAENTALKQQLAQIQAENVQLQQQIEELQQPPLSSNNSWAEFVSSPVLRTSSPLPPK